MPPLGVQGREEDEVGAVAANDSAHSYGPLACGYFEACTPRAEEPSHFGKQRKMARKKIE
jgi:uncharacterized protein (DUF697 family)